MPLNCFNGLLGKTTVDVMTDSIVFNLITDYSSLTNR